MKKLCTLWLCLCCLLASVLPAFASGLSVVTEKTLIDGVTYKRIQALYDNGWQDIHVIQADLSKPYLKFDVLSHDYGKSYRENTYESAKNADALAAVNADFFVSKTGLVNRGSAIGVEITDGVMRTSPAAYEDMNALYQTKTGDSLTFSPFTYSFTITAPDGATAPIDVINKYDNLNGIAMYTTDWNSMSNGSSGNVMEVVVENGIVTAKNLEMGSVVIPENGYVLVCDMGLNAFLNDHFSVGSPVVLSLTTTPSYEDIQTAVGGGGMILTEGKIPSSYSHTIAGTHPRSAVGLNESGTVMTLVAVDGRRSEAVGMTMKQLGYLMADLGCYNAMNLDGGGSTLMAVKTDGTQQVVNTPSDGAKRSVTNSIGVLTEGLEEAVLSGIRLQSDSKTVFANTSVWLYADLLDQYGRTAGTLPSEEITWTVVEGSGSMQNDFFCPTAPGKAVIRAEGRGFTDEISLEVLDIPYRMSFSTDTVSVAGGSQIVLWLSGTDVNGKSAGIYPKDVQMTVSDSSVVSVEGNAAVGLRYGSAVITASMGDVSAHIGVCVDGAESVTVPKDTALPDPQETAADITGENGFRFTVFGNTRTPEKFFDVYLMNGAANAVKAESDLNFFVGSNVSDSVQAGWLGSLGDSLVTADGFSQFTKNGSTFITLKNAYGTMLYKADSAQWIKLQQAVDSLNGGNLFVFLNDHNLSSSDTEITVFKQLMEEAAAKGCNVYVFAGGFVNETIIENGVRYITTAGIFPSIGVKAPATNISYVKYYLVTVNSDKVTYETKGILKK